MPAVILWRRGRTMIVDTSFSEIFCCQVACIKFLQKTEFSYCKAYNYYLLCFFLIFLIKRIQRQSIQIWHVGLFLRRNWRQLIFVQAGSPIKRKRYYSLFSANEFNDFIIEETTLKYTMSNILSRFIRTWQTGRMCANATACLQMQENSNTCTFRNWAHPCCRLNLLLLVSLKWEAGRSKYGKSLKIIYIHIWIWYCYNYLYFRPE